MKRFMVDEKAQDFLRPKTKQFFGKVMKYHPERAEEFFDLVTDYQVSSAGGAEIEASSLELVGR